MMPVLLPPRRRYHANDPSRASPGTDERQRGDAAQASATPRAEPHARSESRRGAKFDELRILLVDDDFLFSEMLPRLLRKSIAKPTLRITSAQNAQEALRRLAHDSFDVVLCDYDLRTADTGLDVLRAASRNDGAPAPLRILITGHSPRELPPGADAAFDAFVDKPMTLRECVPILTALLHERLGVEFELT